MKTDDGLAMNDHGQPRVHVVCFEADLVRLHDNRDASGLRGTGSGDFEVEGALVPDGRWIVLGETRTHESGALYQMPFSASDL